MTKVFLAVLVPNGSLKIHLAYFSLKLLSSLTDEEYKLNVHETFGVNPLRPTVTDALLLDENGP
ncbi:hypothetical protein [Lysinibacillus alkalisoli]|uniref:hypothetical protein n=1 Tax=Lysinibacillus alkalisoli TaxID=1911548 RepID=UPI0016697751|nr:hypothetical protein [Lysinibacillus alkalisoli]